MYCLCCEDALQLYDMTLTTNIWYLQTLIRLQFTGAFCIMMFVIIFLYMYYQIHLFLLCLTVHFLTAGMHVIVYRFTWLFAWGWNVSYRVVDQLYAVVILLGLPTTVGCFIRHFYDTQLWSPSRPRVTSHKYIRGFTIYSYAEIVETTHDDWLSFWHFTHPFLSFYRSQKMQNLA